jgi:hypothetical protein
MFKFLVCVFLFVVGCEYSPEAEQVSTTAEFIDSDAGIESLDMPSSIKGRLTSQRVSGGITLNSKRSVPVVRTVSFSVSQPQPAPGSPGLGPMNPVAEVNFFIDGNTYSRTLSVYNGASISGVSENVSVTVSDQFPPTPGAAPVVYDVTIVESAGQRSSNSLPPTLTTFLEQPGGGVTQFGMTTLGTLPGTTSVTIEIPQNCGINSVAINVITANNAAFKNEDLDVLLTNNTGGGGTYKSYYPNEHGFVNIPPGANVLYLNNHGANELIVSVTWGIDG